jgi:hypothetical protein
LFNIFQRPFGSVLDFSLIIFSMLLLVCLGANAKNHFVKKKQS